MEQFRVELDNSICLPGQTITGNVTFRLKSPENIRGLNVECVGKSRVYWSESRTKGRQTDIYHYQACENYYHHKTSLCGDIGRTETGDYDYKFTFQLPSQLPTSFEGVYGYVRYHIRAQLDRDDTSNVVFKRGFTVNNVVDLNENPQAAKCVKNGDSKTVCCWCCQSGPITASCWLPKSGYVPGETIVFCGHVENLSKAPLNSTTVRLVEKTTFKAQGKQKENLRLVGDMTRTRGNGEDDPEVWDNFPIVMPSLPPSGLPNCTIIDLSYAIQVTFVVNPGNFSFNLMVPIDIVIGTVPLRSSFPSFLPSNTSLLTVQQDPINVTHGTSLLTLDKYPDLPDHSYEQCTFGGDLKEDEDPEDLNQGSEMSFFPQYICYTRVTN